MIKTRIAPSPTGYLHIANARAALFSFIFAKQQKGTFVLRIEDTDKMRSKKEFAKDIFESLTWLGLQWDERYLQSEHLERHSNLLEMLLDQGRAFYCNHPQEETEGAVHVCPDRESATMPTPGSIIRFKTPLDKEIVFEDLIRGEVRFQAKEMGDFSIAKSLHEPLYNFAVVVDDFDEGITHVIRGEDHISNTPKQILLQQAVGFTSLHYGHLPIVLGPDKKKLSKRTGSTSVKELREQGYLAPAVVNMMAFLGWNPGDEREFFTLEELVKEFSLERVKKGGAVFDMVRLNFLNQHYLKALPLQDIALQAQPFFAKRYGSDALVSVNLATIVDLERTRVTTLKELAESLDFIFTLPSYEVPLLLWKEETASQTLTQLQAALTLVEKIPDPEYTKEKLQEVLFTQAQEQQDKGKFLWPLRVALAGKKNSPGPFDLAYALGKHETLNRIQYAIRLLGA